MQQIFIFVESKIIVILILQNQKERNNTQSVGKCKCIHASENVLWLLALEM
jgi:hypothetical protein